jgi:nicotinate phosphoribosyltransferase
VARALEGNGDGELRPVAKRSVGKPGRGGRKWAARRLDDTGTAVAEVITTNGADDALARHPARPLLRQLVRAGEIVGREPLAAARERHRVTLAELPVHATQLSRGYPAIPTVLRPLDEDE